jgi:hypothetical protein
MTTPWKDPETPGVAGHPAGEILLDDIRGGQEREIDPFTDRLGTAVCCGWTIAGCPTIVVPGPINLCAFES